jgi:HK97 family phage portal protein
MRLWPRQFFETKTATLASPDADLLALFGVMAGPLSVSIAEALSVPAVSCAVRVISEAAASLDRRVMLVEGEKLTPDDKHPVAKLLRGNVNPWTPAFDFVRDLVAQCLASDAGGVAWINRVDGRPAEIIHYRAGAISVSVEDTGEPKFTINSKPLDPRDVIWLRGPFTKCPITMANRAIAVAYFMETHAGYLFKYGAKPGGVIEVPGALGEKAVKNVKAGWSKAHEGAEKTGLTAVLWGGAKFNPITLSSTDAQFLELRNFQIVEIARAFRVPPDMLYDLSRATWSNIEHQNKAFLAFTLEPYLQALEGALSLALFGEDEHERYRIVFDRDDLTRASLTERATAINSLRASEVINANEARSWLDMQPRPGGETFENPNITTTTTTTKRGREDA